MKDKTIILGYIVAVIILMMQSPDPTWIQFRDTHYPPYAISIVGWIYLAISLRLIFWLLEQYRKEELTSNPQK